MVRICHYYKHRKICKYDKICGEQLPSNKSVCTSNLYYSMGLEKKCESLKSRVNELEENIKTIFSALIIANHKDIGAIQDTIWVNTYTTLWDYIRIVLNMDDKQFEEFKKQALQKIEEVK